MKRLKIAIFHLAFIYSGGGEKLVLRQAELLAAKGHEVAMFVPVIDRRRCFPDLIGKMRIRTMLPWGRVFGGHESFLILLTCVLAPFFAWRFAKYDVILAANQPSVWIGWWVNKLFGVPVAAYLAQPTRFLYPREIDRETGLYFAKKATDSFSVRLMGRCRFLVDWADRISIRGAGVIMANGRYVKKRLFEVHGVDAVSCPAGADCASREGPVRKIGKRRYLLITNRHFSQKRFEYGLAAFSSLADKFTDVDLVITGEPTEYTREVRVMTIRLGLGKRVRFVGYVEERRLRKLYLGASAYLYTAPEEDFGMGVIEAMGSGVPVVAWNRGGPAFTVDNGKTGFLARPYEVSDFAKKVFVLLNDDERNRKMGKLAWRKAREEYSWKRHVESLEKELARLVRHGI